MGGGGGGGGGGGRGPASAEETSLGFNSSVDPSPWLVSRGPPE